MDLEFGKMDSESDAENEHFILFWKQNGVQIEIFQSDSGNRDLSEKMYDASYNLNDLIQIGIKRKNPFTIVKTSVGTWYMKGVNGKYSYQEIKQRILENTDQKKHTKRTCYLISFS